MSSGNQQVLQWAREFALVKRELPDRNTQNKLQDLWRQVRDALNEQSREIVTIRSLANSARFPLPPRPPTSDSVEQCRQAVVLAVREAAAEVQNASSTVQVLQTIPPQWASDYLKRKYLTTASVSSLGCWICPLAPAHPNGYIKVNLRNSTCPTNPNGTERKLGIEPWLHQLAVVGKGEGDMLALTTGAGGYEVRSRPLLEELGHANWCIGVSPMPQACVL
jgi:hypothetical protein